MNLKTFLSILNSFTYLIPVIFLISGCSSDTVPSGSTAQQQSGKSFFVSATGNDNNPGSFSQPWKTIQKAANTIAAGDTVYVRGGTYGERIIPRNSGTSGNYIVYRNYQNEAVTIDGSSVTLPNELTGLFHIAGKSYVKVSGLRIINAGPNLDNAGFCVTGSSFIILYGNSTYSTVSSGIGVWGSNNIIIDSNEVELACNDGGQECITIAGSNTFEVKNNFVHNGGPGNNGGEGIDAKDGSFNGKVYGNRVMNIPTKTGIYVDAWDKHTYNIQVYNNLSYNNSYGILIASEMGGLLENIKVYNNVFYNNKFVGIMIISCCIAQHPIRYVNIINNTVFNNGQGAWGGGILNENPQANYVIFRNNISSKNLSFQIALENGVQLNNVSVGHNLVDGFRGYTGELYGRDSVTGDPGFFNPSSSDFHLTANSIAIDRGSSLNAPLNDFDGIVRPQGQGFDIGAFEYFGP